MLEHYAGGAFVIKALHCCVHHSSLKVVILLQSKLSVMPGEMLDLVNKWCSQPTAMWNKFYSNYPVNLSFHVKTMQGTLYIA